MSPQYKVGKTKGSLIYFFQSRRKNLELILLIMILGISSTILMGKYAELKQALNTASEQAFFGNLQSALLLFASEKLMSTGRKTYPDPETPLLQRLLISGYLHWNYQPLDDATGKIEFMMDDEENRIWYYSISPSFPDSTEFFIVRGLPGVELPKRKTWE